MLFKKILKMLLKKILKILSFGFLFQIWKKLLSAGVVGVVSMIPTITHSLDLVISNEDNSCPNNYRLMTFPEAKANVKNICRNLSDWYIARLAGGGSMDGSAYNCKIRPVDERSLGNSVCIANPQPNKINSAEFTFISDVFVGYENANYAPTNEFTNLSFNRTTLNVDTNRPPSKITKGINGQGVWIKIKNETTKINKLNLPDRILVDIKVTDWGDSWSFPKKLKNLGYEPPKVNKRSLSIAGALSPGTDASCKRMGLALKYINTKDKIIDKDQNIIS